MCRLTPMFAVHVIILPIAAKSLDINNVLIILIIFIMLLNFQRPLLEPPPPHCVYALAYIFQKLNTFLFKFEGSNTPH